MPALKAIESIEDIPQHLLGTPIGDLLEYHNLDKPHEVYTDAALLIGMCMDHRKMLDIPRNFAYIIRDGAARMTDKQFRISFAITIGGIRHIAVIGHSLCGMVGLDTKRDKIIKGLVETTGWDEESAKAHFTAGAAASGIDNAMDFTVGQVKRLRELYPGITAAALFYKVEDDRLYLINE
jgi:carbonic anhydrase